MLVITVGDIIGLILLAVAVVYCIYIFIRGSVIRHDGSKGSAKAKPKTEPKKLFGVLETKEPASDKSDPKTLKALAIVGLLFIVAIALAFLSVKK